jgi:hypothetical protein
MRSYNKSIDDGMDSVRREDYGSQEHKDQQALSFFSNDLCERVIQQGENICREYAFKKLK